MKATIAFGLLGLLLLPSVPLAQVAQTQRQLEHSKLFQHYGKSGFKVTETKGGYSIDEDVPLESALPTRLTALTKMACQSDAVIVGKVASQTAVLSPDESFIFTDAEVSATEILKNNSLSELHALQTITVTRPGGGLVLNGKQVKVALRHFRDFSTGGQYLLFLKFLPTTQDYQALWNRSFELKDGMVLNLTPLGLWHGQQQAHNQDALDLDGASALADARAAAASSCR